LWWWDQGWSGGGAGGISGSIAGGGSAGGSVRLGVFFSGVVKLCQRASYADRWLRQGGG